MTIIIGVKDHGVVYMGCDSRSLNGSDTFTVPDDDRKITRRGDLLFGVAGQHLATQLLNYRLDVPAHPDGMGTSAYLFTLLIPAIRTCFDAAKYDYTSDRYTVTNIMIGYRGGVFVVGNDWGLVSNVEPIMAMGGGQDFARGAWTTLEGLPMRERIVRSMEICALYTNGVAGPYHVETLAPIVTPALHANGATS